MSGLEDEHGVITQDEDVILERIHTFYSSLYNEDQSGFVQGRFIMDNVLTLKLVQDLANITGEPSLFCKLDFEKAFDRVSHAFLWRTLETMRFNQQFIYLVSDGRAKVHINGHYTRSFTLEPGVRQGCPISPLLFALSTQPLMRLLREEEKSGRLTGVNIPKGHPLLHKLFADDSGIAIQVTRENFYSLRRTIESFERVSGALFNLSKSVILPLVLDYGIPWLNQSGCQVLGRTDATTYLGCQIVQQIQGLQHFQDVAGRLNKRIANWSNRFLSWTLKIILFRHVLKSITTYQFLGLGFHDQGYTLLEGPCRLFLWGQNPEGRSKTTLVTWRKLTKRKENGGIGISSFQDAADTLKMRYIGRLLEGEISDWATMIRFLIHETMNRRKGTDDLWWWSVEECLLLLPTIQVPKTEVTRAFVKSWMRFRRFLSMDPQEWELPSTLNLHQLTLLIKRYWPGQSFNDRIVLPVLKKLRITMIAHLFDSRGCWKNLTEEVRNRGFEATALQADELRRFQDWCKIIQLSNNSLQQSTSWRWRGAHSNWKGWRHSSKFWGDLLKQDQAVEDLTCKWPTMGSLGTWKQKWQLLWSPGGSQRAKLWIWRVLHRVFFTGSRAAQMQVVEGTCTHCELEVETVIHLFWSCEVVKSLWKNLDDLTNTGGASFRIRDTLLAIIDEALQTKRSGGTLFHTIAPMLQTIWRDRNKAMFKGTRALTRSRKSSRWRELRSTGASILRATSVGKREGDELGTR
ncbi:hypothetical protein R1sor_005614 [Riccia sorocarpa]|uniref:Reverse transcriptase domain-containing protein n=1 Tax=Riccia sorocarpa TaxID=122646 RepID=A0ABD3HKP4_9MARC